jgi:hypothetical protein
MFLKIMNVHVTLSLPGTQSHTMGCGGVEDVAVLAGSKKSSS